MLFLSHKKALVICYPKKWSKFWPRAKLKHHNCNFICIVVTVLFVQKGLEKCHQVFLWMRKASYDLVWLCMVLLYDLTWPCVAFLPSMDLCDPVFCRIVASNRPYEMIFPLGHKKAVVICYCRKNWENTEVFWVEYVFIYKKVINFCRNVLLSQYSDLSNNRRGTAIYFQKIILPIRPY